MKWFYGLFLVSAMAGCGGGHGVENQVPTEPVARQALDAALAAWQQGQPPATLAHQSPRVQVVDSMRRPGQKLIAYEILGEVPSDRQRSFLVQLRLDHPAEAPKVRFCVVGLDPLWVFREDELEMISRWACNTPEETLAGENAGNVTSPKENAPKNAPVAKNAFADKSAPASKERKQ